MATVVALHERGNRLRRSDCTGAGITRVRRGKGFSYHLPGGARISDPEILARITALVIPPAWVDVWICPHPDGHIQAVGTDDAGRRQYRYHDRWLTSADASKHARVLRLAEALPGARVVVDGHLSARTMSRERTLAAAFRVLDLAAIRIGSERYAAAHHTYGLATLRREHAQVHGDTTELRFTGKGGKPVDVEICDHALALTVRRFLTRDDADQRLLAWRDRQGWHSPTSRDINEYVRQVAGEGFSAKDFRTWNATVLMACELTLEATDLSDTRSARTTAVAHAVRRVADFLNNTPAVARSSYIDRRVVDLFHDGVTLEADLVVGRTAPQWLRDTALEAAVLDLVQHPRRRRRRAVAS